MDQPWQEEATTNEKLPLFRGDAKHPSHISAYGEILLIRPISFTFIVTAITIVAAVILAFLIWGTYTKRSTLTGQLVPDLGLIKVYSPQFGVIVEKHVVEGSTVKRGDVLYVVSSELRTSELGDTQAMVSQQVEARRQSYHDDIDKTKLLERTERQASEAKLVSLQRELSKVDELIKASHQRVSLAEDAQKRYDSLGAQGYLSKDQLLARQTDLLDQRQRLQSLERDKISLQRQVDDEKTRLDEMATRYQTQIADYQRSISSTEQELTQSEIRRRLVIVAPEDGTATTVVGEIGQAIDASRALLSIVPSGAKLQAHLYAPSRAVGFVKPGDSVYLRYQAYPYQKFGHYHGIVEAISTTAVNPSELLGINASIPGNSGEQVYRIKVSLDSQGVMAYGKERLLQTGMIVDGDVLQEKRRLYEWVLEPLLTITGKIH